MRTCEIGDGVTLTIVDSDTIVVSDFREKQMITIPFKLDHMPSFTSCMMYGIGCAILSNGRDIVLFRSDLAAIAETARFQKLY